MFDKQSIPGRQGIYNVWWDNVYLVVHLM